MPYIDAGTGMKDWNRLVQDVFHSVCYQRDFIPMPIIGFNQIPDGIDKDGENWFKRGLNTHIAFSGSQVIESQTGTNDV